MQFDSKQLFNKLVKEFTLPEDSSEKEAILLLLMEELFQLSRAGIMAGKTIGVDEAALVSIMDRLNNHEPVQYILGSADFYGRKFNVDPVVLIPRQETELMVRYVAELFNDSNQKPNILDIGTGSGCIAISLALEIASAVVHATDISTAALAVAQENSKLLKARVQFSQHDILKEELVNGPFDVMVSNPPYVPINEKSTLKRNVREFEPAAALFVPATDPYIFYEVIASKASKALTSLGLLLTEINAGHGNQISDIFKNHGFRDVEILKDLAGLDRIVKGSKI